MLNPLPEVTASLKAGWVVLMEVLLFRRHQRGLLSSQKVADEIFPICDEQLELLEIFQPKTEPHPKNSQSVGSQGRK